jgi:hypothetical protein
MANFLFITYMSTTSDGWSAPARGASSVGFKLIIRIAFPQAIPTLSLVDNSRAERRRDLCVLLAPSEAKALANRKSL